MGVEVFDVDLEAAGADFSGKEFGEAGCPVPPACTTDGDPAGAGGQGRVVGEVGEQLAGAGGVEDDVLDAGVEAVEVEDVAGGGRVAKPGPDVRSEEHTSELQSPI